MADQDISVTAADFVRHFAKYREAAHGKPVIVTNHGRRTHALLSIEDFNAISDRPKGQSREGAVSPLEVLKGFANWISEGMLVLDRELRIVALNQQFEQMVHMSESNIVGRPVQDLHVNIRGSVAESLLNRTVSTGQSSVADFPSFFHDGRWIHMQSFPWGDHIVALYRDITEEVTNFRLADVKQVILNAMDCHGGIGYARISTRGTIDRCDGVLCDRLGLSQERLTGVPFVDLVDIKLRVEFRESLENCLRSNVGEKLSTRLLSNSGDLLEVDVGLHGLHGTYGVEGAIIVMTFVDS